MGYSAARDERARVSAVRRDGKEQNGSVVTKAQRFRPAVLTWKRRARGRTARRSKLLSHRHDGVHLGHEAGIPGLLQQQVGLIGILVQGLKMGACVAMWSRSGAGKMPHLEKARAREHA